MKVLLGLVLLLLLAGGGYYLYSRNSAGISPTNRAVNVATNNTVQNESGAFEGTLSDLIKRGGNYKCDWAFNESGTSLSGTTYVSGNKFSGVGNAKTKDVDLVTNMVGDGAEVYTWVTVAGFTSGTKFPYSDLQQDRQMTAEEKQKAEAAFKKLNYDCSAWTPEPEKFVIPTSVNFTSTAH